MSIGVGDSFLREIVKVRATRSEKEARDFQRAKDIMDHIDIYYGDYRDYERIKKFKINYNLLNGHLPVKLYEDPLCFTVNKQEISFDFQNISHTPLIAQYANAFHGEEAALPFHPTIRDFTPQRPNMLKKKALKVNKKYLVESIINPARDQILQDLTRQMGGRSVFEIANTPEKQLELEQQVNLKLQDELPRDVMDFVNGNITSTTAKQAQKIMNWAKERFDFKWEKSIGFKHAIATGEEYYFVGVYNGQLQLKAFNPTYFSWGGGDRENEWCNRADWCKRERWLSYQQTISRHAASLDGKDFDIIDLEIEPIGGYHKGTDFWDKDAAHTKKMMYTYSTDEGFREAFSDVDIKTHEGRKKLFQMYDVLFSRYADKYGANVSDYGIREAHIQWRDLAPFWIVTRTMPNGIERDFWLPEHYEPTHLDYNIRKTWKNQIWEGYKLGTYNGLYVDIQELPHQYKSMFNPHDVDFSYYGKKYHINDGITGNVALVDLGKSAQKNFDMVLASIKQKMATNIGKVFTLFFNMVPEGWTYQEWLDLARNAGIIMLDPTQNTSGIDPQFLKDLELSKMGDLAAEIQLAEFYRSHVALSMYFNDVREGAISQYANATNVQQNAQAVHNKTAWFMEQHRKIFEEALTGFLNRARFYLKENPEIAASFLDDVSLADLMESPISWYEWFGIELKNSPEELKKIEVLKGQMHAFIQNTSSTESVMQLILADTVSEIVDIVKLESKKQEEQAQLEHQRSLELLQTQNQNDLAKRQQELQYDWQKHITELKSKEKRTLDDREKFKMQNDVDMNQINDILQKTVLELQAKMAMHDQDILVEREKIDLMERLEKAKIQNVKLKINKIASRPATKN